MCVYTVIHCIFVYFLFLQFFMKIRMMLLHYTVKSSVSSRMEVLKKP